MVVMYSSMSFGGLDHLICLHFILKIVKLLLLFFNKTVLQVDHRRTTSVILKIIQTMWTFSKFGSVRNLPGFAHKVDSLWSIISIVMMVLCSSFPSSFRVLGVQSSWPSDIQQQLLSGAHMTAALHQLLVKAGFTCGQLQQVKGGGKGATWTQGDKKNPTNIQKSVTFICEYVQSWHKCTDCVTTQTGFW